MTSLFVSALHYLGETNEDPKPRLVMAKQTIDLLEVLKEKTAGNLDNDESQHLAHLISELQLKYVEVSKGMDSNT